MANPEISLMQFSGLLYDLRDAKLKTLLTPTTVYLRQIALTQAEEDTILAKFSLFNPYTDDWVKLNDVRQDVILYKDNSLKGGTLYTVPTIAPTTKTEIYDAAINAGIKAGESCLVLTTGLNKTIVIPIQLATGEVTNITYNDEALTFSNVNFVDETI